jgi:hypothetical protein
MYLRTEFPSGILPLVKLIKKLSFEQPGVSKMLIHIGCFNFVFQFFPAKNSAKNALQMFFRNFYGTG